jgi:hypothetical protein
MLCGHQQQVSHSVEHVAILTCVCAVDYQRREILVNIRSIIDDTYSGLSKPVSYDVRDLRKRRRTVAAHN